MNDDNTVKYEDAVEYPVPVEPKQEESVNAVNTSDAEVLYSWIGELDEEEIISIFEVLGTVDALAWDEIDGNRVFRYNEAQRRVLAQAKGLFRDAGFTTE